MFKIRVYLISVALMFAFGCATPTKIESEDDFATDATAETSASAEAGKGAGNDELSLDDDAATVSPPIAQSTTNDSVKDEFSNFDQNSPPADVAEGDLALENELNKAGDAAPPAAIAATLAPSPAPEIVQQAPAVVPEPTPAPELAASQPQNDVVSQINSVDYKSNENGGTIIIKANNPLQYTTRINSATNQLVVEVQNTVIPKKLKRSLNTKDMASSIGAIDIYQKPNSKISRFVIQLRPGSPEPLVQPEGNTLLVVGAANPQYVAQKAKAAQAESASQGQSNNDVNPDLTSEGIMSSQSLEDFLASNNRFYGKKISIETNNLEVKDAIKFIAEESGVNMILDDSLTGKVSLKLRQVPWDQALVLLLKSKKLGYRRQGNVLRIARIEDIMKEEDDAIRIRDAKSSSEPLVVRRFFIGYADMKEMETKIREFLFNTSAAVTSGAKEGKDGKEAAAPTSRARLIADSRTSSIIVTETESNMLKIEKLIAALDTQPQQVLIEGKVIEASEAFTKSVGVRWRNNSATATTANRSNLSISPLVGLSNSVLSAGLTWGQLDILGDLNATLDLGEQEEKVRVLSSPRITVLSSQTANISQTSGVLIPKLETSTPTTGGAATVTKSFEIVQVGVMLKVTPQVSNEGTVTLDMDIERSFLPRVEGSVPNKRNAKTKVIVKNGQTAVIGGIFETQATESVSGVPGLKDIPILGHLFKGAGANKSKSELVIFVTPRIIQPIVGDKKTTTFE
ncbi:MAG: type IV pilus secretin PilQ [Bdellovibrionaceae bacterium]|nr:type IV pilus secretin PilQ [Bdellovibrio sp.]